MANLTTYGELRDAAAKLEQDRNANTLELLDALEKLDPELVNDGLDLVGGSRRSLANYLTRPMPAWGGATSYEMLASGQRSRVFQLFNAVRYGGVYL